MSIPIDALAQPFPPETLKQRKGNFGQTLDYVDAATVIQRLNEALEGRWSFTVLDYRIDPDEVIVKGELKVDAEVRQQFGGSSVTRKQQSGETVSIADDLKAATADCLKKCASSFGVGLYLYGGKPASAEHPTGNGHKSNGGGRVSNDMISRIFAASRTAGVPQSQVIKMANDLFRKPISQLTALEADQLLAQYQVPQD